MLSVDPRITAIMQEVFEGGFDFDPDRFLKPAPDRPPHAFTPGWVGTHACPGMSTGLLVCKTFAVFLARLLSTHSWTVDGEPDWNILPFKTIMDNFTVQFTKLV